MAQSFKYLGIEQLDEALKPFIRLKSVDRPQRGWIRSVRQALGMSAEQLAQRIGLSRPTVAALERSESRNKITLESLEKLARGLGCLVVYVVIPKDGKSFMDLVRDRATVVAREQLARVSHTMRLEAQDLSAQREKRQLDRLVDELLSGSLRKLW